MYVMNTHPTEQSCFLSILSSCFYSFVTLSFYLQKQLCNKLNTCRNVWNEHLPYRAELFPTNMIQLFLFLCNTFILLTGSQQFILYPQKYFQQLVSQVLHLQLNLDRLRHANHAVMCYSTVSIGSKCQRLSLAHKICCRDLQTLFQ